MKSHQLFSMASLKSSGNCHTAVICAKLLVRLALKNYLCLKSENQTIFASKKNHEDCKNGSSNGTYVPHRSKNNVLMLLLLPSKKM